ncbi:MAG TPA: DegT/DnrJ/EryC1/StrS family aminotransferase [Phycisphaerae bacterium]|nr:DegT/DnrJ/EryC1/StrS family aminotransferase [Phycisphaerae bacterium]
MNRAVASDYERAFADFLGARHAFAFWKGRVALYAILRSLGIGEGDEVILPGYTCVMNVNPIMYLKARPVYVDIDPVTYNLKADLIEKSITPRTRVIIAQHTYGYAAPMDEILAIAARHGLKVVEDCCLALGSRYKGRFLGTYGIASYFSSQWNKPYTTGIGGMAITSDDTLAGRIRELIERERQEPNFKESIMLRGQLAVYRAFVYPRTTALITSVFRWLTRKGLVVGSSDTSEFVPAMTADFFKGVSGIQVCAGLRQIRRLERGMAHRRDLADIYTRLLGRKGWTLPAVPADQDPVLVRFPVRVADKAKALAAAPSHCVELGSWFECPLHPIDTPMAAYGYEDGMCPVAERACREVVNLPTHPRADHATAERSVNFIAGIGPAPLS